MRGRKPLFKRTLVVSTRIDADEYQRVQEIAALETINTGRLVTAQELIRDAITFVYGDNERLRECFRRTRQKIQKRHKTHLERNKAKV